MPIVFLSHVEQRFSPDRFAFDGWELRRRVWEIIVLTAVCVLPDQPEIT